MTQYIARRLIQMIPVLFLSSFILFVMLQALPGDPAARVLGDKGTPAEYAALRHKFGIDRPLPVQYVSWLGDMAQGDLGESLINGTPTTELLQRRLPATIELSIGSMIFAFLVGIPMGTTGALFRNAWIGRFVAGFNALALAVPVFWLGILLSIVVGLQLRLLPAQGYVAFGDDPVQSVRLMILPSITLGLSIAAIIARFLQSALLELLHEDWVRTATSKGLSWRSVILRHILKNALIPVVTVAGFQFGALVTGAVITESVFTIPGFGNLIWTAIRQRDYFIVQSTVMLILVAFILINLATDILYAVLDPRIRYS